MLATCTMSSLHSRVVTPSGSESIREAPDSILASCKCFPAEFAISSYRPGVTSTAGDQGGVLLYMLATMSSLHSRVVTPSGSESIREAPDSILI